ncbi:MAG: hypothetical protein ABT01_07615, partial [Clostridium sp. SCN 57-10]
LARLRCKVRRIVLVLWIVPVSVLRTAGRFDYVGAAGLAVGLIGVLNTAVDFAVFYALNKMLRLDPYLSQIGAFIIAALNSFLWNKYWTFEKRAPVSRREVTRYLVTNGMYLLLSLAVMRVLIQVFSLDPFLAKFPTAVCMVLFNYLMAKLWVFSN